MVDKKTFREGMAVMLASFPHLKPADNAGFVSEIWFKSFQQLTNEQFLEGIQKFVMNITKLYPTDNWVAMLLDICKPKIKETVGDIVEMILSVLSNVSFVYPNEDTKLKLAELKEKSPIAYAVGNRLGWSEMAKCDNQGVLTGQIRAIAIEEINRANREGKIYETAKQVTDDDTVKLVLNHAGCTKRLM